MHETKTLQDKFRLFVKILIPILITQVGLYSMNFTDTLMSGRAGASDLAGVAIGSSIWVPVLTGINGILIAISPIVAQALGAKEYNKIPFSVRQGIYLSICLAVIISIIGYKLLDPILNLLSLEEEVKHVAKYYLIWLGIGMIPLFVYNLLRSFVDALGQTKISMLIILIALPVNVFFNYMFIYGKFGAPKLGGIGAGVSSTITYFVVAIISIIIIQKIRPFKSYQVFSQWSLPSLKAWKEQLKIGIPIGFTIFFETSIFAAVTLFMSAYNTETIAAHQAANNFASLFYMFPLAIAMTLTITVGFEVGAKRIKDANSYTKIGIYSSLILATINGLLIYIFREEVANIYSTDHAVINLIQKFLIFAIFFQLSDGIGAPIQGVLRGYKDVNITLIISFISFWVIGLPTGYIVANYTSLGPFGYWIGLIVGLAMGAFALFGRLLYIVRIKNT